MSKLPATVFAANPYLFNNKPPGSAMTTILAHRTPTSSIRGLKSIATALLLSLTGFIAGCGGGGGGYGGPPPAPTLASLSISAAAASIGVGATSQFVATGAYSDGSKKDISASVTWSSATAGVASISTAGLATAVAVGTTSITAASGSITSPAVTLTVTAATLVSIAVTPTSATITTRGHTVPFRATGTYTDKSTKDLTPTATWASATPTVATVSNTGLATGFAMGTTAITATSGSITSPAATLTVTIPEYAYITNYGTLTTPGNTVSQYSVGMGGELTPLAAGPTVLAGKNPFAMVVHPSQHYAYVANHGSANISQYNIGADGSLTPMIPAATVASGTSASKPNGLIIDSSGTHLYVANFGDGTVSQYSIDLVGALTPLTPATVPADTGAASIALNPAGTFAYVANFTKNTVSEYTIDAATGALTLVTATAVVAGSAYDYVVVDPTGQFVYVAARDGNTLTQFNISASGALNLTNTFALPAGGNPSSLTLDPAAKFIYVPNSAVDTVLPFSIGSSGGLTQAGTTSLPGAYPQFVAIDPSGQYAYVAERGGLTDGPVKSLIAQFTVGISGALTALATPTVASGKGPTCIVISEGY